MHSADQSDTDWRDGVPVSKRYGDPYFSLEDGLAETRHVFLAGNDLPARFRPGFAIAELGFGTGLNVLCAWQAWLVAGHEGALYFKSFERHPLDAEDLARAHAAFPELAELSAPLVDAWATGARAITLPGLTLEVRLGDANDLLPAWDGAADAWFLDGFAPARNPDLWSSALMRAVACHTFPGGTVASYTAAGHVRRALDEAGFAVTRQQGYGRKRHMTRGILR